MAFTYKHGDRPLDGYEIQRGVGRGGFGEVYYAISDGGREVALKYLRENPEVELRGIASCINLKSPHLVSIFDVKQNAAGEYFVIMEYVSGPSLRELLIAEPHGLGHEKAAYFTREIARGLGYLHDRGIVHRDLKPGNIFYEDGYVKICDYGLSKYIAVSRHSAQTASVGTVHYMAPEVGSGNYSRTIDIYALGVVLYEMLLGRVPYEGASMGEVLMKHLTGQPEVAGLPAPFPDVIAKALAKDPNERFQTVNEMVEAIFGAEDIRKSVLGLEPSSLSTLAARAAMNVPPSPHPSDNPMPIPPAPQRIMGGRNQGAGDAFSQRFVERTAGLDARLTRKEQREAKRRRKRQERAELLGVDHDDGRVVSEYRLSIGQRLARMFAAVVTVGGAATVVGFAARDAEAGAFSMLVMVVAVLGIGIGYRMAKYLGPDHPVLIRRLLIVGAGVPALGIMFAGVEDGPIRVFKGVEYSFMPLLAILALCNWRERIRLGQSGEFGWWEAFAAGLLAFIAAAIFSDGDSRFMFFCATLGAGTSLAAQVFAWALVRNPRVAHDHHDDAGAHESPSGSGSSLQETQYAPPPSSASRQRMADREPAARFKPADYHGTPNHGHGAAVASGRRRSPGQRGRFARVTSAFLTFVTGVGIVATSVILGTEVRHDEERVLAISAIVGLGLAFLTLAPKMGRWRKPTWWAEWGVPALRVVSGTGAAAGGLGMGLVAHHTEEMVLCGLVATVSGFIFLFLLGLPVWRWLTSSRLGAPVVAGAESEDLEPEVSRSDFVVSPGARK